jgi:hypothetical protein
MDFDAVSLRIIVRVVSFVTCFGALLRVYTFDAHHSLTRTFYL